MQFNKVLSRTALAVAAAVGTVSFAVLANPYEVQVDASAFTLAGDAQGEVSAYIVQVKGKAGVERAEELGELLPARQSVTQGLNRYNSQSSRMQSYTNSLKSLHQQLAADNSAEIIYSYTHTFNGFSAKMTAAQAEALRNHPNVVGVWKDEAQQLTTANTPEFLGLNAANEGLHALGIKGENVVVGIVDTGIWPEHPSFADDGSYEPLAGWNGTCDVGDDTRFSCNNKLIGARYFKDSFESTYKIQPGEFHSPRDADNHGTHVASTAAGNEGVTALINNTPVTTVTGIAPRARVAMYKACWNSDYVSPTGVNERGCFYGDTMAAIDAAVADGVDVINYSIGGSLTDLTTISAAAMLRASQAGVFMAVSAGNSGPTAGTIGTPAPWVTTVAASTYDGFSVTNGIEVTDGPLAGTYAAVEGSIFKPLKDTGDIVAEIAVGAPYDACTPLTNAAAVAGKIALLQRGTCDFALKVTNAQAAGAVGVVMSNNVAGAPSVMGGTGTFNIPAVMVALDTGNAFRTQAALESFTVKLSPNVFAQAREVGNTMASFSSRGENMATPDVIKPDITAPGVKILAGASAEPMLAAHGNTFAYLQGTSMSSPHIAGMAALVKEANPSWTPAMIKSALMTTARQNVTKENGITPATPFDFGAGHAAPNKAINPGLTYDIEALDYFAFLCGVGNTSFVQSASGYSCQQFIAANYNTDPSQLNLPSLAIGALSEPETLYREVTDVTGTTSVYTATVEAPAGVSISVVTAQGGNSMTVPANGKAAYGLTFTAQSSATLNSWVFGSITWSNGVNTVRSPIAVRVVPRKKIVAPESFVASVTKAAPRITIPVEMRYSGDTSTDIVGLAAPYGSQATVSQDANYSFSFNEAGLGSHWLQIPAGVSTARFSLYPELSAVPDADLDMYVYRCASYSCTLVGQSASDGGREEVTLVNPVAANNSAAGNMYIVFVHGYDLKGRASATYTMPFWVVNSNPGNARLTASTRAIEGRYNNVTLQTSGLAASFFPYLGVLRYKDQAGVEQARTLVELYAN